MQYKKLRIFKRGSNPSNKSENDKNLLVENLIRTMGSNKIGIP